MFFFIKRDGASIKYDFVLFVSNFVNYLSLWSFNSDFKFLWNPVGGIKQSAKTKIETIDDDNMVLTYSIFDGEMSESYKSLKITLQVIGKEHGGLVKWTYEYEKLKEDITGAPPESYLEFAVKITKDIDAHLVKE